MNPEHVREKIGSKCVRLEVWGLVSLDHDLRSECDLDCPLSDDVRLTISGTDDHWIDRRVGVEVLTFMKEVLSDLRFDKDAVRF